MKNREIKFRVWNGSKMEYNVMAGLFGAFYVQGINPNDAACMSPFNSLYDESTLLMEYSGEKDHKGNDIYDGDIVQYDSEDGIVTAIVIHSSSSDESMHLSGLQFSLVKITDREDGDENALELQVIGNIYENSELL